MGAGGGERALVLSCFCPSSTSCCCCCRRRRRRRRRCCLLLLPPLLLLMLAAAAAPWIDTAFPSSADVRHLFPVSFSSFLRQEIDLEVTRACRRRLLAISHWFLSSAWSLPSPTPSPLRFPEPQSALFLQVVGSRADENTWKGCTLPKAPRNHVWVVGANGCVLSQCIRSRLKLDLNVFVQY